MRVGRVNGGEWMRLAEAAAALGVSHNTLRHWSDEGRLTSYRSPGGHRRFRRADIATALGGAHETEPTGVGSGEDRAGSTWQTAALQALAGLAAQGGGVTSSCIVLCDGDDTLKVVAAHPSGGGGLAVGTRLPLESLAAEAEVLRSRHRLVISDLAATSLLAPRRAEDYLRQGVRALLVLPITVAGRPQGVLRLADTRGPHDFTADAVTFAELMARHAGLLVTGDGETRHPGGPGPAEPGAGEMPAANGTFVGARAPGPAGANDPTLQVPPVASPSAEPGAADPARTERLRRALSALTEEGLEDTVRIGPETVLRVVVKRLAALTGVPIAEVYAVEGETYRALTSYDTDHFDGDWEDVVLPLARYPASRRAVESGEVVLIPDLADPLLNDEGRFSLEKWGYQSQVSLPLFSAGQVIGLVELCDYVPHDFSADLDLIRALARVAAHALETGLFAEQVARRGRVIDELVQIGEIAVRAPGLDALLRQTAERLQRALDAASCDIFRVTDDDVRCAASYDRSGFDERPVGAVLDLERHPAVIQAMNAHEVLMVTEVDDPKLSEAERLAYRELGYASEVCVPVVLLDRLLGFIDLYDTRPRDYTEYVGLLRGAGHLLAAAFENARLEARLERRAVVVGGIAELGALGARAAGHSPPLTELAQSIRTVLAAADCEICSVEDGRLHRLARVSAGGADTDATGAVIDCDRFPAAALALLSGEIVTIADLDDPRLTDEERRDMGERGYRSELCIPLVSGERITGLIDVLDVRPRDYASHGDYLQGVGRVAAAIIGRAVPANDLERAGYGGTTGADGPARPL